MPNHKRCAVSVSEFAIRATVTARVDLIMVLVL